MNWFFGDNAALTFATPDGEPVSINGSQLNTLEGTSSISDSNGVLLFYTDGIKVWNRNHEVMNPRKDMTGHYSSTQSTLISKMPGSNNIYYIFTTDGGKYVENINPENYINRGFRYSVVDMELNNGLGEVIEFNHLLYEPTTEKLTAVYHKNKNDVWILSYEWGGKNIHAHLLSSKGVEKSVISQSIVAHSGEPDRYIGHLKASPTGDKVAFVVQGLNFIELHLFDNQTGELSNPLQIPTDSRKDNYGLEFSPNGQLLYVSEYVTNTVYQYDISSHDADKIKASEKLIQKITNIHSIGALQLAPNGKIYLAMNDYKYLGVINNPDKIGDSCEFIRDGVFLGNEHGVRSRLGLPNLNQSFYNFEIEIDYKETCQHEEFRLHSLMNVEFQSTEYEWYGPNGLISIEKDLIIPDANSSLNGRYIVIAKYRNYTVSDSIDVKIKNAPFVKIKGDTLICQNSYSKLEATIKSDTLDYFWSNGERGWQTVISAPGNYSLRTIHPNGCVSIDSITVKGLITNAGFANAQAGNFGRIPISNNKKIIFEFENNSVESMLINSVYIKNKSEGLKVSSNYKDTYIKGNSIFNFVVDIFSKKPLSINDSLIIEVTSPFCVMQFNMQIIGEIIVPVTTRIPSINGKPADIITIPVISKIDTPTDTNFVRNFDIKITIPTEYFQIESCSNGSIVSQEFIGDLRLLTISGARAGINSRDAVITSLKGKVMVGMDAPGVIAVEEIDWKDSLFVNTFNNGELLIESCTLAIRPIQLFKPTNIVAFPNLATDEKITIKIESTERGNFVLNLVNILGKHKKLFEWNRQESDAAEKVFHLNLNEYSTGSYYLILQSPWYINSAPIQIIR